MISLYVSRFLKNKLAVTGAVILILLCIAAITAPWLTPYEPQTQDITNRLASPTKSHIMGTDDLGRDVLTRVIYSTRISLTIGLIAVSMYISIGTILGLIAGYYRGFLETVIMRLVDIMLCFPVFFLLLTVIAYVGPSIYNIMIVIGVVSWTGVTRLVRAETISIRERDFILAARGLGLSDIRILLVHILPNVAAPILVAATLGIGGAILAESGLSFLGLGVQPPTPSWGNMLTAGKDYIYFAWWLSVFPGLSILTTVLAFNLLGEGLRDVLDPRM
ncbi:MAG: ABC transporter permease [bacterium]